MKRFFGILLLVCSVTMARAQGLYDPSPSVTKIWGVWTNGRVTNECPHAISSNSDTKYVRSHYHEYKNIRSMRTEKLSFNGSTYYILEIEHILTTKHVSVDPKLLSPMTRFLALTEEQNRILKNIPPSIEISLVQIPSCSVTTGYKTIFGEDVEERVLKEVEDKIDEAILKKDDIMSVTYSLTARKEGDFILFNYDVDCWTHNGDVTKRDYEKLDLYDNLDGGYFKIPVEEWEKLFAR